jgi:imidazolonepropionase-like amidohydrolase
MSPNSRTRPPAVSFLALALTLSLLAPQITHADPPRVHAIVGARIVTAPGHVIERGTIVMRDGIITAIGRDVAIPADATVWREDSLTVYPGMIDVEVTGPDAPSSASASPVRNPNTTPSYGKGAGHELSSVRPEGHVVESLPLPSDQIESLRGAGFAAVQVIPRRGIVRGQSAVIGLGAGRPNANLIANDVAQVVALNPDTVGYPGSLMGAVAVVRQALIDARWYHDVNATYAKKPDGKTRPEENVSWAALEPVIAGRQPLLFLADDMLEVLRAEAIAREAGIKAQIAGAGDEYKRAKDLVGATPLVVPVNFPAAPDVSDPDRAVEVSTEELRYWNEAPGNPAALARAGATFALTASGLADTRSFRARVGRAIGRGLDPDRALAAVTTVPAALLGLSDRLGTIAIGKIANLTVVRGDLFSRGKLREVWVDGNRYESSGENSPRGSWSFMWGGARRDLAVRVDRDTVVKLVTGRDTLTATGVELEGSAISFNVKPAGETSHYFFLTVKSDHIDGTVSSGEASQNISGARVFETGGPRGGAHDASVIPSPAVMGNTEPWRMPKPAPAGAVLIKNATLWTAGPQGTLPYADLLVRGGKIVAIGHDLVAPKDATVIDGSSKHVSPGIIDCHSHSAILGNVNECTHSVTAEVRIQDVINSESINIYRQLASGGTIMHLLHGSCNSIGGQCAVIKNKWGEPPDRLLFAAAPQTIKFALGENPKQSNYGRADDPRYPQTRSGVEETIRDAFTAARDYGNQLDEWRTHKRVFPPRRDLQKEAVLEILQSKRFIHCHSYRQDEILMLMRLTEEFGIHVQTFQHILEGYKVADEMATHGASASTFSDWWAYKYEVIDAIPYNGYLMWDRGVTVSYNSDSDELARRLNTEAAKAVKYGGVPPNEAIKFVTLNPAKQLRIDDRVGSLEVGKDADFAIWNGSPLSPYSLCLETWIEGQKYFDRAQDLAGRAALAKEREALIDKARWSQKEGGPALASNWPPRYLESTDMSGNECGEGLGENQPFMSETLRRAIERGEARR